MAVVPLGCAMALAQFLPIVNISWVHDIGWLLMHPGVGCRIFHPRKLCGRGRAALATEIVDVRLGSSRRSQQLV